MGKIKTGISTDSEFRKALTDKGANLRIDSTPEELLTAFTETGAFVSYQSPNETILEAINAEEPVETVTITYDLNGGTYQGETTETVQKGVEHLLMDGTTITAPQDMMFDSWTSVKDDGETKINTITPTEGTTVYALYKEVL